MLQTMLKATLQMSTAAPVGTNRGSISGVFDPFNSNVRRNTNATRNNRGSVVNQLLGRPVSRSRSTRRTVDGDLGDLEGGKRHGKVCFVKFIIIIHCMENFICGYPFTGFVSFLNSNLIS